MLHLEPYYTLASKESTAAEALQTGAKYAWNKDAHFAFLNKFEETFVEKCKACVALSQEERHSDVDLMQGKGGVASNVSAISSKAARGSGIDPIQ